MGPIEELKKRAAKKGLEVTARKEDMVEALFIAAMQEEMAAARKTELQAKSNRELEELLSINGLEKGSKDHMIKMMLAHEKKCSDELKVFEEKVNALVAKKQAELENQSRAKIKEMSANKG